jgi:uncharacterized protein YndB with AHSA1/START domain
MDHDHHTEHDATAAGEPGAGAPGSTELIEASPDAVFAVLTDPATYPDWLVGAQHIRSVDDDWPAVGSKFHHAIGVGPAAVPGSTSVRRCSPDEELVLAAGMGPLGEAAVRFVLTATADGTLVRFTELPVKGPARLAWRVARPFVSAALWGRNAVSLASLARVVRDRAAS